MQEEITSIFPCNMMRDPAVQCVRMLRSHIECLAKGSPGRGARGAQERNAKGCILSECKAYFVSPCEIEHETHQRYIL